LFSSLKEDKQWDSWQRSTIAQARAQDISEVLDERFTPDTPEARELFWEKQKFMYAVFEKNLLTDKGKALVRHYGPTFDAQKVYQELSTYAKSSTQASMDASTLLTYITSAKLGPDGLWKGKAHGFILHWQDKIRQYELLLPTTSHFPIAVKRAMLENAVAPVSELRAVKNQASHLKTQNGGIELSYEQYCNLLASAAQEYDGSMVRAIKPNASAARRSVYMTDVDTAPVDEDIYFDADLFDSYNIDSDLNDILEANAHGFGGPRLNADQWSRLPKEAQAKWDELDREHKAIILEHKVRPPGGQNRGPPRRDFGKPTGGRFVPRPRPPDTAVNLHDISAMEYLVQFHHSATGDVTNGDGPPIEVPPEPDPAGSALCLLT
jgi:hypothetical protein